MEQATDPLEVRTDPTDDLHSNKSIAKATRRRAGRKMAIAPPMSTQSGHDAGPEELASLTQENFRLKRLLSEKLTVENETLRMMLARF
ncbi:hypothetical protein [Rhizobium sp.]|uniref:hypothetical protein n=1 Tax=Rhizobium sp. TaxID=391 RepID=UPI0028A27FDE